MKAETPDKELNEAIEFYATLALKEQIVVDTDAGFVSEKGEPVFTDMNPLEAKMRDMMNTQSRQTLEKNSCSSLKCVLSQQRFLAKTTTHRSCESTT
mgnify:CR=1 FL=1